MVRLGPIFNTKDCSSWLHVFFNIATTTKVGISEPQSEGEWSYIPVCCISLAFAGVAASLACLISLWLSLKSSL
jgi:hypothetical protein